MVRNQGKLGLLAISNSAQNYSHEFVMKLLCNLQLIHLYEESRHNDDFTQLITSQQVTESCTYIRICVEL